MPAPCLHEPFADDALAIKCPLCGDVETDPYEVLDDDEVHLLRCAGCGGRFYRLIAECPECAEETAITWSSLPTPSEIQSTRCSHCDARLYLHDQNPQAPE